MVLGFLLEGCESWECLLISLSDSEMQG